MRDAQVFVRCGAPVGTLAVMCSAKDTVQSLKEQLAARSPELGPCRFMVGKQGFSPLATALSYT